MLFAFAFPAIAPYGEVFTVLGSMEARWALPLGVLGLANLFAPSTSQVAALPSLSLWRASVADWATTTVTNLVPGGSVIGTGMTFRIYRSWGFPAADVTRSILLTGLWDVLVKLIMPTIVLMWLLAEGEVPRAFWQAAAIGVLLLGVGLAFLRVLVSPAASHQGLARLLDWLPGTGEDWNHRLVEIRQDTRSLLAERAGRLTFWTLAGHLNVLVLLVVCVRAVGIEGSSLGLAAVATAFAFGRLITAIPVTPGGLGVMEAGLIGALAAVGDAPNALLVAAVFLFRAVTFAVPTVLGGPAILWLRASRALR